MWVFVKIENTSYVSIALMARWQDSETLEFVLQTVFGKSSTEGGLKKSTFLNDSMKISKESKENSQG